MTNLQEEVGLDDSRVELSPQIVVSGYRMQRVADATCINVTATQDSAFWQAEMRSKKIAGERQKPPSAI